MTTEPFIRTHDCLERGEVSRMYSELEAGRLVSLRAGWHLELRVIEALSPEERECLAAHAAFGASRGEGFVFSHETAAALHGIPLLGRRENAPVHITVLGRRPARSTADVTRHRSMLPDSDITEIAGLPVTTLARTIVDIGCAGSLELATIAADAAANAQFWDPLQHVVDVDHAEDWRALLRRMIAARPSTRGVLQARWIADTFDARSDSPGESLSRLRMLQAGWDPPAQQIRIRTSGGTFYADFELLEFDAWGEFDGKVKYRDPAMRREGQDAADVVIAEKRREDLIRATTGRRVIRWGWEQVRSLASFQRHFGAIPRE